MNNVLTENDRQKLTCLVESINPNQFKGLTTKIKFLYPDLYISIKNFQEKKNLGTFSEALYLTLNNMNDVPECKHLSTKCKGKLKFKNFVEGYFEYCKSCSSKNEDFKEKRQETNIEKYGYKYPTQNILIKNKIISKRNNRH